MTPSWLVMVTTQSTQALAMTKLKQAMAMISSLEEKVLVTTATTADLVPTPSNTLQPLMTSLLISKRELQDLKMEVIKRVSAQTFSKALRM